MDNLLSIFVIQFIALFFTIDPIGLVPIFLTIGANLTESEKYKAVKKGVLTAFLILLFFALLGTRVLDIFGISLAAFKIAGGILLLILSIGFVLDKVDVTAQCEDTINCPKTDISVFPLAIPLLSGPAAISMLIIFMKQGEHNILRQLATMSALFINMALCFFILHFAKKVSDFFGKTGISIITRIFGILLTALACQFIIDGIIEAFHLK